MAQIARRFDPETSYTALGVRVDDIDRRLSGIETAIAALGAEIRASGKTQWPTIFMLLGLIVSVLLGFGGAVGMLALSPVREAVVSVDQDLKSLATATAIEVKELNRRISDMPENYITRPETDRLAQRAAEERSRVVTMLDEVRGSKLDRSEWVLRNDTVDRELDDVSRRIEEIRERSSDTYTLRDVVLDLQERLDRVEQARRSAAPAASLALP